MVSAPVSPCINLCTLDENDVCRGCFRSRAEIGAWSTLSATEQWQVIERSEQRRLQALKPPPPAAS